MASAHDQWMSAWNAVRVVENLELKAELEEMLSTASVRIEDHDGLVKRSGLELIREVHSKIREANV